MNNEKMYVVKEGNFYVLRQERYRQQLEAGREHPHDSCAIAGSVDEMRGMIDKHWPNADYSTVRNSEKKVSSGPSLG